MYLKIAYLGMQYYCCVSYHTTPPPPIGSQQHTLPILKIFYFFIFLHGMFGIFVSFCVYLLLFCCCVFIVLLTERCLVVQCCL